MDFFLPCNNFIYNLTLFSSGAAEVDARCLDAFVSHKVSKQGDVIELVEEVLGEAMAERVWIDDFAIQTIFVREML